MTPVEKRQLWNLPTETHPSTTAHCTPFTLPSNGVLSLQDSVITLTTNVVFQPECTGDAVQFLSTIQGPDPFYASTIPQTYVIAAATVIAWILVIMLIITPRTNFPGRSGPVAGFSSGHGIIGGATGGTSNLIGVGSRPWLQKVAALTVAISLTIATADFFQAAEQQYEIGYMDANMLKNEVLGTKEIRITRIISDVFLWLAQVQTLIRLFPRHKEKVLIKWIGFALILFDSVFSCLNSFYRQDTRNHHWQPRQFVEAIPALSYLFELALGLLYAAWVIYYSLTKRRYAFYHSKMRSICVICTLSLIAVLTPVVFFVTDVSNPKVAGWGDYFRWVGAAAASVVVWEWVERIEALERDEKKDGILGREIFDGDEMLDVTPNQDFVWEEGRDRRRRDKKDGGDGGGGSSDEKANHTSAMEKGFSNFASRFRNRQAAFQHFPLGRTHSQTTTTATPDPAREANGNGRTEIAFGNLPNPRCQADQRVLGGPTPPPAVASPVSRTDTTSAASTVYVVRNDTIADMPQPVRRRVDASGNDERTIQRVEAQRQTKQKPALPPQGDAEKAATDAGAVTNRDRANAAWYAVANSFKRKRASPPAVVQQARHAAAQDVGRSTTPAHNFSRWDVKNRIGVLAAETGDKLRDRRAARHEVDDVPVTVIPAQPRGSGRTWTPPVPTPTPTVSRTVDGPPEADTSVAGTNDGCSIAGEHTSAPPRTNTNSASAAGGAGDAVATSSSSRSSSSRPPRADDISPVANSTSPVIIPAPRRSQRSSPLAVHQTSASDGSDSTGESSRDNG